MRTKEGNIARLLRRAQWLIDDVAHRLPEGRCSAQEQRDLATMLTQLAQLMHEHAGPGTEVVDAGPTEVSRDDA